MPLVVATCDAGLHPWQARMRDALVARRPGRGAGRDGAARTGGALCSYGRGRVNLRAVAEVLTGRTAAADWSAGRWGLVAPRGGAAYRHSPAPLGAPHRHGVV